MHNLGLGAASGLLAASVCFPLDTVRRQMQMRTCMYQGQVDAMACIWRSARPRLWILMHAELSSRSLTEQGMTIQELGSV